MVLVLFIYVIFVFVVCFFVNKSGSCKFVVGFGGKE